MSHADTLDAPLDTPVSTPAFIDISEAELDALIQRVEDAMAFNLALSPADCALLLSALRTLAAMQERLQGNDLTLLKLRKLLGIVNASEKGSKLFSSAGGDGSTEGTAPSRNKRPRRRKAHTTPRIPPTVVHHPMEGMSKGDTCPGCRLGKVYKHEPSSMLRITGHSPFSAHQHVCHSMRCNACGEVFRAELPAEVLADGEPGQRYGYSARAVMAIYKYFAGEPFFRRQSIQELFGISLSASTIFDQCEAVANALQPIFNRLKALAAEAQVFYIDDTTHRILDQKGMEKKRRGSDKLQWRTGVYTSSLLALYEELCDGQSITRRVVLFQTSIGHAGEWVDEILTERTAGLPAPVVISDASSNNRVTATEVIEAKCNVHSRRNYAELTAQYPEQMRFVLDTYRHLWVNDHHCSDNGYGAEQRREYHHTHSLPAMQTLKTWGEEQLTSGQTEPNSNLGKAIEYFNNHYDALSRFCHFPGIPIDNNEIERLIKLVVRSRKNAGFYKTQAGAWIGDVLTSVLAICQENGVNAFEYLTAVQRNQQAVRANPDQWLPWNYCADP